MGRKLESRICNKWNRMLYIREIVKEQQRFWVVFFFLRFWFFKKKCFEYIIVKLPISLNHRAIRFLSETKDGANHD